MISDNPVGDILAELNAYGELFELLPEMTDEAAMERIIQATRRRRKSLMNRIESLTKLLATTPIDTPKYEGETDGRF